MRTPLTGEDEIVWGGRNAKFPSEDAKLWLERMGAKGYHNPMWEQDNAGGGTANPGQSLAYAQLSYDNLASLRG